MPYEGRVMAGIFIAYTLLLLAVGASIHWYFTAANNGTTIEAVRMAKVQADGSVSLMRIPIPPANLPPAPHIIPKGAKETARIHVIIKPRPSTAPVMPGQAMCKCDPIAVELSLIHGKDGSGVIASSEDADIDSRESVYTPIFDAPKKTPNSVMVMANQTGKTIAATYARDIPIFGLPAKAGMGVISQDEKVTAVIGIGFGW